MTSHTYVYLWALALVLIPRIVDAQAEDFLVIKNRVVQELLKEKIDDERIPEILDRMEADGSFSDINYHDLSRTAGFPHRRHTADLLYLAKAYQKESSRFYQDQDLKKHLILSLSHWVDHDFFGDNWHNNQITTPSNLVNLMLLFGSELDSTLIEKAQPIIGRAHMNASGARPSGDRIVIAGILAKNLLFVGNRERFNEVIRLIAGEVKFTTGKRGIQHDYSFHHRTDRVNNTTSYGYGKYANAFGEWSYYVANTRYAFALESINQLVDYYLDGIYKQLVYGIYTDISVKNRSITNRAVFRPQATLEIERLLFSTDYRKAELQEILRLRKGKQKPSRSFCKFFWQTEHLVFQRPGFYTTVRMFSTRNRNMEVPYNGPGKPTHHRADGTNYLMLRGDEYHNIWPVYDWQKISGTTIMQKPRLPAPSEIQKDGLTDFVGAVTDGLYGAAAFDFRSPHDGLTARKSWFFFEKEYVCLGAGINAGPRLPVLTTINQVLQRTSVKIQQGKQIKELPEGEHTLPQVKWVYQDQIGYLFPTATTVNISNQVEQGRWSDITDQKNVSTEMVEEDVFALWLDHGFSPDSAAYQYIVVPNTSEQALQKTSKTNRDIEVLSNSIEIQAVKHKRLGLCQMTFYKAGKVKVSKDLSLNLYSQGMVMIKMSEDRIQELTVADPSRKLQKMVLEITGIYKIEGDHISSYPNRERQSTVLMVDLPQGVYAGKSARIILH